MCVKCFKIAENIAKFSAVELPKNFNISSFSQLWVVFHFHWYIAGPLSSQIIVLCGIKLIKILRIVSLKRIFFSSGTLKKHFSWGIKLKKMLRIVLLNTNTLLLIANKKRCGDSQIDPKSMHDKFKCSKIHFYLLIVSNYMDYREY